MPSFNVSFPDHLKEQLGLVQECLPKDLQVQLQEKLQEDEIPYDLVLDISKWTRTDEALRALEERKLDSRSYDMVPLLAGTVTSPSVRYSAYEPPPDPMAAVKANKDERRAIVALLNAVFSVLGVAGATWYAAGSVGWTEEAKVLLALLAAVVVAVAEGGLYLILTSRRDSKPKRPRQHKVDERKKKDLGEEEEVEPIAVANDSDINPNLRHRTIAQQEESPLP